MIRQRPIQHKRKNSQLDLFYPNHFILHSNHKQSITKNKHKKISNDKKSTKLSLQQKKSSHNNHPKNILKLVQNSEKKAQKKQTVIQNINQNHYGNQNIDYSNGAYYQQDNDYENEDQNNQTYFQFGRRGKSANLRNQNYDPNYNYLNMQEITQVPDTMSNQRRYQNSNFYQFPTSNQNSLINFSNKFVEDTPDDNKDADTLESKEMKDYLHNKNVQESKNLKKRKLKMPKNILIQGQELQQKFDLSQLGKENKKNKLFFVNKKDDKKSKSKQNFGSRVQKQKSRSSLFLSKKSKNLSQINLGGGNKKSLSLKNGNKNQLKILQKKPKSFQKQKDLSQTKTFYQIFAKPAKSSAKSSQKIGFQRPKNLQIGDKMLMIEQSQSKLQNQYKIILQCVGELWQNTRITRYISQKNKSDIMKIKQNQRMQDQKMIKLKSQILSSISSARY